MRGMMAPGTGILALPSTGSYLFSKLMNSEVQSLQCGVDSVEESIQKPLAPLHSLNFKLYRGATHFSES